MPDVLTAMKLRKKFNRKWKGIPPKAEWYREGQEPALRIWRAISWIERAEKEQGDPDVQFILYWIAFNAAYAQKIGDVPRERALFDRYFDRIIELDRIGKRKIDNAIWNMRSDWIEGFIDNRFVFQRFWDFHNNPDDDKCDDWEPYFEGENKRIRDAIYTRNIEDTLSILFGSRLYTLRNQLVHGGSSWNSNLSRTQVNDGVEILKSLVPIFIDTMMDDTNQDWGHSHYPRHPDIRDR